MEEKRISPLKAIRLKCLDCSCGSSNEVKLCPVVKCPLYPFRHGHNPNIGKRELTDEQREAAKARMAQVNRSKNREQSKNAPAKGKNTTEQN